jgi:hypothetical protein
VEHRRAYYHCRDCGRGHFPFDEANGLQDDRLSSGLRPLVCLAGLLGSFAHGARDVLRRFTGVRLSAASVRRATEKAGDDLARRQQGGRVVRPQTLRPWDFTVEGHRPSVAYLGLDAFSVPIQGPGAVKAEHRMIYAGVLYTPDKERHLYLADFELDRLVGQMREASKAYDLGRANQVIAISDGGNGLEQALRRHFWDDLLCVLDWYHASEHLHAYARCLHGEGAAGRGWAEEAKGVLYEQGGTKLLEHLRGQPVPEEEAAAEERRKLVNYFADNEHRTNYPEYRKHGWDIGSGPTEAACKVVGARLKGSGMRWAEEGAARVAPLRALYLSGPDVWDAFWALAG